MGSMSRLDKLEHRFAAHPTRCDVCASWSACRVLWPEDGPWHPSDPTPAACPSCGWEPTTIKVRYVDADGWKTA